MIRPVARLVSLALSLWVVTAPPALASFLEQDGVRDFIASLAEREAFNTAELRGLFEEVERQDAVLEAIARPAEGLAWHRYRPIFVTEERARGGAEFMRAHADALARAEVEYGVPPEIVTAIIGVETFYGRHKGRYPVLDTLATLAFAYPPRADFFRDELEQFLVLAREEGLNPRGVDGSYAGAMGMPQFISSSYRHYAIDFDGDGRRDLWDSTTDVIGSVAAYLSRHGWQGGATIVSRVGGGAAPEGLDSDSLRPAVGPAELRDAGIDAAPWPANGEKVALIELESADGPELWLGWQNFYAITRYNHSALYAMAVFQLAERIGEFERATAER
ncbi:MAG: lytic murein transglycosylase B [Halofilum sp. (in: g-proteobacteria)]